MNLDDDYPDDVPVEIPSVEIGVEDHFYNSSYKPIGAKALNEAIAAMKKAVRKEAQDAAIAAQIAFEKVKAEEKEVEKRLQENAAIATYKWMKVFAALADRGMDQSKIMESINKMQENGHSAEMCLEMIEKTEVKKTKPPKEEKLPPRPEAFGSWA